VLLRIITAQISKNLFTTLAFVDVELLHQTMLAADLHPPAIGCATPDRADTLDITERSAYAIVTALSDAAT